MTKVELDELLAQADFITLHVPMTDKTRGILNKENLAKTKPGVRIINCAVVVWWMRPALAEAIKSGHVAGAGLTYSKWNLPRKAVVGLPSVFAPRIWAHPPPKHRKMLPFRCRADVGLSDQGCGFQRLNMPSITAEEAPSEAIHQAG